MSNRRTYSDNLRKSFILHKLVLLLFLSMSALSAFAQQKLAYYLEIDEEKWDGFNITITINNNRFQNLYCTIPSLNENLVSDRVANSGVFRLNAIGDYGDSLLVTQIDHNSWLIAAKKSNIIIISYKLKKRTDDILGECLSRRFARIDGGSVFLHFRDYDDIPIYLSVRVPHNWKLATGLSFGEERFTYHVRNYDELRNKPLYMAPFADIFFTVQDRTCYVILDGDKKFDYNQLTNMARKIVTTQIQLFRDLPFDNYLFIFRIFPEDRLLTSKAYENSTIVYASAQTAKADLLKIGKVIASDFFQVWNGFRFYPSAFNAKDSNYSLKKNNHWFLTGVSDYYGHLNLVRAGLLSDDDLIQSYLHLMNYLYRHGNQRSMSLAAFASPVLHNKRTVEFIKTKGHLVGALLDLRIRELTKNQRSLDDVIYFLNKWLGDREHVYQEEDLLRAINAVCGTDLTTFFDQYIYGVMELPIADIFQTAGIYVNSKIETIPDLGQITISDETNEVLDLDSDGPLGIAGLKIGDKLLSFANQKIYSSEQLQNVIDTLRVSRYVDLTIQRDKLFLMLSARVVGRECRVFYLTSATPKSDSQQLIRRTWLSGKPL